MTKARKRESELQRLVRRLKAEQVAVAKHRDALRDLESDVAQVADDCEQALESLDQCIDILSQQQ